MIPADPDPGGVAPLTPAAKEEVLLAGPGPGATLRALRTVGFNLLALACFTLPAIVLWWHVWSGHPSSSLTCGCGDPAQEVWFMAWPAWAISHLHSVFFSGAVNVPHGANLLSNTSGPLVGVVLAPVTWLFGPVTATNVALTLAPALSVWACFAAIRPLISWKAGAIPAALVYGYSAAIVTSLAFGHVSVTVLVIPPFLFTTLHEIVIRQEHSVRRDGIVLAALLVAQFFISPEILVMCLLLAVIGLLAVMVVGWRQLRPRAGHALPTLGLAAGVTVVLLAYPAWYGLSGPQAVSGMLFARRRLRGSRSRPARPRGVRCSRQRIPALRWVPRPHRAAARLRRLGRGPGLGGSPDHGPPPPAHLAALSPGGSDLLAVIGGVPLRGAQLARTSLAALGGLSRLPVLKEILPDQFVPLLTLFLAFLIAVGLDSLYVVVWRPTSWLTSTERLLTAVATAAVAAVAVVPVFVVFDAPHRGAGAHAGLPAPGGRDAPREPGAAHHPLRGLGLVPAMLWQATEDMHFRLAGAASRRPTPLAAPSGRARRGRPDAS